MSPKSSWRTPLASSPARPQSAARPQSPARPLSPPAQPQPPAARPPSLLLVALLASLGACATNQVSDDVGAPPDAATIAGGSGDGLPVGAIAFFKTPLCPNGWFPYLPAVGRFLVPTVGAEGVGETQGTPLQPREDRAHAHGFAGKLELRGINFAGIAGEANHSVAAAGMAAWTGRADQGRLGLPYVQLLTCQKSAPPKAARRPLPRGTLAFFAKAPCPEGWTQAQPTQGRFLVANPDKAPNERSFGGEPLGKDQAAPKHTHAVSGGLTLPAVGVALASGCCASGYAGAGAYSYSGTSEATAAELPMLRLLQCQKLP